MNIINNLTARALFFGLFLASVAGMAFALYLQYVVHLNPCPLCVFQRIGLIVMGFFSLLAALIYPKIGLLVRRLLWGLSLLGISWSFAVASRHVWLTYLPADKVPSCGPGLDYWVQTLPISQVLGEVLRGSGECAVIDWRMLGFSLPELSLAFFAVLVIVHGWLFVLLRRNKTVLQSIISVK